MHPSDPLDGEYIPGRRRGWSSTTRMIWYTPVVQRGIGFGSALAITISYVHNQSIGWAILHGLLSWLFVVYAALFY